MRPVTPNGVIIEYNLTVVNLNTGNVIEYIVDANPNQEMLQKVVCGFSPYQNYTASVSASIQSLELVQWLLLQEEHYQTVRNTIN